MNSTTNLVILVVIVGVVGYAVYTATKAEAAKTAADESGTKLGVTFQTKLGN